MNARGSADEIVTGLTAGRPQKEVAAAAGISERTLRRRQNAPHMVEAVAAARADLEREALGRLSRLRDLVFGELESLLGAENSKVRLATADLILRQGLAYRTAYEQDRLRVLEATVTRMIAGIDPDTDCADADDDDEDETDWDFQ